MGTVAQQPSAPPSWPTPYLHGRGQPTAAPWAGCWGWGSGRRGQRARIPGSPETRPRAPSRWTQSCPRRPRLQRKGRGVPVRQPVNQAMLPGPPSQGLPQHKVFMERSRGIPWPAPATPYGSNHHGDQETQAAHGRKPESVRNERRVEGAPSRIAQATE